jgi:D-sedoheptulose 7-phosphate isomerase
MNPVRSGKPAARGRAARARRGGKALGPLEREARAVLADAARAMARLERRAAPAIAAAAEAMIACLESGGTVFFCGNGGSAADAQHFACELAGRYLFDRPSLASIALTTNSSSLTAIGNDYGFDDVFARQLESLGTPGDVLVALTTSGGSRNVVRAVETAHALGMIVIGMTGLKDKGPAFAAMCDLAMVSPHAVTPRIQEGHLAMGHAFCELVERSLFGHGRGAAAGRIGASARSKAAPRRGATTRPKTTARGSTAAAAGGSARGTLPGRRPGAGRR